MKFSTKSGLSLALSAAFLFGGHPVPVAEVAGGFDGSGLTVPSTLTQIMHLTAVGEAWGATAEETFLKNGGSNAVSVPFSIPDVKQITKDAPKNYKNRENYQIFEDKFTVVRQGTKANNPDVDEAGDNPHVLSLANNITTNGFIVMGAASASEFAPPKADQASGLTFRRADVQLTGQADKNNLMLVSRLKDKLDGGTAEYLYRRTTADTDAQWYDLVSTIKISSKDAKATSNPTLILGLNKDNARSGQLGNVVLLNDDGTLSSDMKVHAGTFTTGSITVEETTPHSSTLTVATGATNGAGLTVTGKDGATAIVDLGQGTLKVGDSTAGVAGLATINGSLTAKKVTVSEKGSALTVNEGLTATGGEVTVLSSAGLMVKGQTNLGSSGKLEVGSVAQAGTASLTGALTAGELTIENPATKLTVKGNTSLNTMAFNQGQFVITEGGLDVEDAGVTYIGSEGDISATLSVTGRPSSFAGGLEVRTGASAIFNGGLTTTKATVKSNKGYGLTVTEGPTKVDTLAIGDGTTGTAKISELNAKTVTITGHDGNKLDIGTLATMNDLTITQGHMTVGGKLTVDGEAVIGASGGTTKGFLTVGGMATFNESLTIHEGSKATFNGGLYVKEGGLHVHSDKNIEVKNGDTTVSGNLEVGEGQYTGGASLGATTVTGQLIVSKGEAKVTGTLKVNGKGENAVGVNGGATEGTLLTTGHADLAGSLTIHENSQAAFNGGLKTGGDLNAHSNKNGYGLIIGDGADIGGALNVGEKGRYAGAVQLTDGLTVAKGVTVTEDGSKLTVTKGETEINAGGLTLKPGTTGTFAKLNVKAGQTEIGEGDADSKPATLITYDAADLGGDLVVHQNSVAEIKELTADKSVKVYSTGDGKKGLKFDYGLTVENRAVINGDLKIGDPGNAGGAQFNHGLTVNGRLEIPWGGLVINDGDFIADQGSTNTVIGGGNHGVQLEVKKGQATLGGNLTVNKHAAAIFSGGLTLTGDGNIEVLSTGNTDVAPAGSVNYGLSVNGAANMPDAKLTIGEHGTDNGGKAIFMGEMNVGKVDMANKDNALIVGSSTLPHSYKTEKNNFIAVSGRRTMKVNELDIANAPLISVGDSKSGANLYVNKVVKAYGIVSPLVIAQAPDDAVGTATIVAFNEGPYGGDFDTRVAVGKNAMVAFGFTAEQLHATGGLWSTAKDMAANGAFVTSKPLDLTSAYSSVSVGLTVGSDNQDLDVVRARNNELHLESGSLAVLDIPNDLGRNVAMLTANKFVLGSDGTKGRAINNDGDSEGAKLYIQHDFYPSEEILVVKTGAEGITINGHTFDESQEKLDTFLGENWTGDNLVLSSKKYTAHWASHPRGEKARSAGKSNEMWLSIDYKPTCELLPGVGSGTCHMIDDIYENGDSRDDNPGIRHIVDAVEDLDHDTAAKVIEGATNIVAIAGVPTITNNIMGKVSGLVGGHSLERIPTFDLEGKKSRGGVWAMPFYDYNKTEGFKVSGGLENAYDMNYGGAALGVDYWFGDNLQAGAAVFAGSGKAKATGNFDRTDNDFDFFGASLYDTIAMGRFLFATDLGFTKVKNDIEQSIAGRDLKAKGVDSEAFTAGLTAYYAWRPLGELTVLPHAGARYTRINTDEAKVQNKNGADLYKIKTETQNLFQVPVGVKLTNDFTTEGGWDMTPSLDLGALFTMGDTKADGKVSIVGTRYSAATTADVVDKAALTAGVGFKAQKGSLSMELNYNALVSDHQTDHGVSATLHYLF